MNQHSRAFTDWLVLGGFCGFLFFFGLSSFGLLGPDEPRYAQVAREMFARHDWITPTLGGKPWLEKPVLYYWQAVAAYRVFDVSDWAARLPSAVDATLMVMAVYWFLRRFRPGFHLDGALITASTAGVIGFARAASMDMPLAACFTLAMLAWYAWHEGGDKRHLAAFYACVGLATLAKGPVAPFLAAAIILLFAAARREWAVAWKTFWLPGVLLFCAVALPWYIALQLREPEFLRVFIVEQNLARFGTNRYHHPQPFWFYVPVLLLALLPWTTLLIPAVQQVIGSWKQAKDATRQSENGLSFFLLIWLLVPLLFFSLSRSKLPGYILPGAPAGALLLTEYLRRRAASGGRPHMVVATLHAMVAAVLVVPAVMMQHILVEHRLSWGPAALVSWCLAVLLAVAMVITLRLPAAFRMLRFVTLVPVVLAIAAVLRIGAPRIDAMLSARPVAIEIGRLGNRTLILAVSQVPRDTEYGLQFYRNQAVANYERNEVPSGEHLVIAPEGAEQQLRSRLVGRRVSYLGTYEAQRLDYFWIGK